jgi:hypothetical protein
MYVHMYVCYFSRIFVVLSAINTAIDNWEMQRFENQTLFELSKVILGGPPTM